MSIEQFVPTVAVGQQAVGLPALLLCILLRRLSVCMSPADFASDMAGPLQCVMIVGQPSDVQLMGGHRHGVVEHTTVFHLFPGKLLLCA